MIGARKPLHLALPALMAAAAAVYALLLAQSFGFTVLEHRFRPDPIALAVLTSAFLAILALLWILTAKAESRAWGRPMETALREGLLDLTPLLVLFLAPLALERYFTALDLRARLAILGALAAGAVLVLRLGRLTAACAGACPVRSFLSRAVARFESLSGRRRTVLLFLAAFIVYNLATFALVSQDVTFSGDEPNYLLTAQSLLSDGDINLADEYADQEYFRFYSREDNPRLRLGVYGRYGKQGQDHIYSIHMPGISVLMLPFYALAGLFDGRMLTFLLKGSLSIWAALLGVQIYLLARERWRDGRLALGLWAVYGFTAPVLFFATHIYPEVPIAFAALLVYRRLSSDRPLRAGETAALGGLLAVFPWFGLKYSLILWPLALVGAWHLLKRRRTGWARAAALLAPPAVSIVLYLGFAWLLYGTFSPLSIYEGVMTAEQVRAYRDMIAGIPLHDRLTSLFDYFLDQRDGLLLYAPVYGAALLGFVEMFRRARRDFVALLLIAAPFVLNYAFLTHRQGHSPQGRVLASISWIGAIAIGFFLAHNRRPAFRTAFVVLAALSLAAAAVLLFHPPFLYQPTTHEFTERPGDLFVWLSNMHVFLPPALPSFIKIDNTGYLPNYLWILGLAGLTVAYALGGRRRKEAAGDRRPTVARTTGHNDPTRASETRAELIRPATTAEERVPSAGAGAELRFGSGATDSAPEASRTVSSPAMSRSSAPVSDGLYAGSGPENGLPESSPEPDSKAGGSAVVSSVLHHLETMANGGDTAARRRRGRAARFALVYVFLAAGIVLGVLSPLDALYPSVRTAPSPGREIAFSTVPLGRGAIVKPEGRIYLHAPKRYRIVFSSTREIERLRLVYGSEAGDFAVRARLFDLPLPESRISHEIKNMVLEMPAVYRVRHLFVYEITVDLEHLSDENLQLHPFLAGFEPVRED